jgi:hypothetical protein
VLTLRVLSGAAKAALSRAIDARPPVNVTDRFNLDEGSRNAC